jgi:hypothetical protein
MITIVDYKQRTNQDGEPFIALVLEGDMELVKSESGRYYATARRTSIPSSFTEETVNGSSADKCLVLLSR